MLHMHRRAKLLSLDQQRQKQLLNLMFIYKLRHLDIQRIHGRNARAANVFRHVDIQRIHGRNARAANVFSFTRERYHNNKYKNSPFYKGAVLWDKLPLCVRQCVTHPASKMALNRVYNEYNEIMS